MCVRFAVIWPNNGALCTSMALYPEPDSKAAAGAFIWCSLHCAKAWLARRTGL